jgi:hypothetical protein
MSSSSMTIKSWQWACLLLMPGVFFAVWKGVIRPHEVKRLRVEASQTAHHVIDGFSSHLYEDLNLIEQNFLSLKQQTYGTQAAVIDSINDQFGQIQALEAFVLPPVGQDSALVFLTPM